MTDPRRTELPAPEGWRVAKTDNGFAIETETDHEVVTYDDLIEDQDRAIALAIGRSGK